jgi:urease gamma subunit
MTTQQTENQKTEIYGIYGTHTTEACPLFNEENKKLLLQVASTFEEDAKAKGIKILSMYHSGLEHTFEWIVEAPGGHAIQDLMVETKVAKFNSTKIVPLRTTQNVVEYLQNQE